MDDLKLTPEQASAARLANALSDCFGAVEAAILTDGLWYSEAVSICCSPATLLVWHAACDIAFSHGRDVSYRTQNINHKILFGGEATITSKPDEDGQSAARDIEISDSSEEGPYPF